MGKPAAPWDHAAPKKTHHHHMKPAQIARAKAWASAHGQKYPSLVANMAIMKKAKK